MAESFGQALGSSPAPGAVPLDQILTELKGMKPEEKSALMQKTVKGMGTLPPKKQADLIRMGMKMQKQHAQTGQALTPEQQQTIMLAQDAVKDVPPSELNAVSACMQETIVEATKDPARIMMVARELPTEDRAQLQQTLVENKIVTPEQEAVLDHALQPNGLLDQVGLAAEYLEKAKPHAKQLLLVPVIEWCLGGFFSLFSCEAPLPSWLCWDGFGMLFTFCGFYGAYMSVEHVKNMAMDPPPGLKEAALSQDLNRALATIPPEKKTHAFLLIAGILVVALGLLCQALWAVWGVMVLLNPASCNGFVSFVCKIVVAVKSFLVIGLIAYCAYQGKQVWEKMGGMRSGYSPVNP